MRSHASETLCTIVVAISLAACGSPPVLKINESDRFTLRAEKLLAPVSVSVADLRPEDQKRIARFGGYLQLGDKSLEPTPPDAIAWQLQSHVDSSGTSAGVRRAIQGNKVELRHFQVLAVNKEVESRFQGLENQTLPGVLVLDAMITSLLKSSVGSSRVRVLISIDVGDIRFSSDESMSFTASPGSDAPAKVLAKALQPIYRRLEIAYGAASR